jgi:hypothetical protein
MSMEKGTRTRLATILILFLVLATGSVLGIAVDRRLEARGSSEVEVSPEGSGQRSGGEEDDTTSGARSSSNRSSLIVEQVGLSEAQHAQVDSIVSEYRRQMRSLHAEVEEEVEAEIRQAYQPRYRVLLSEVRDEVRAVLTEDQRMAYDSLLVEYDRRREERRSQDSISDSRG